MKTITGKNNLRLSRFDLSHVSSCHKGLTRVPSGTSAGTR